MTINFSCQKEEVTFSISNDRELLENNKLYQLIDTKLKNNTNDTIKYYNLSCSYNDFYGLYGQELFFDLNGCDKNIPIIETLLPNEEKTFKLKLKKSPKIVYGNVKIGFFLYKPEKGKDFDFDKIYLKNNQLTSNKISF